MASLLLSTALSPFRPTLTRAASSDSGLSGATATTSQARLSDPSTPPTSTDDSESITSTAGKLANGREGEAAAEADSEREAHTRQNPSSQQRSRRPRDFLITYGALKTSSPHALRRIRVSADGESSTSPRRRIDSGAFPAGSINNANVSSDMKSKERNTDELDGVVPLGRRWSSKKKRPMRNKMVLNTGGGRPTGKESSKDEKSSKRVTRSTGQPVESLTKKMNVLGKRGRDKFEAGLVKAKREIRRLADTNEFAKIDTKPVLAEVWSKGKLVTEEELQRKRVKVTALTDVNLEVVKPAIGILKAKRRGPKVWLNKGLYAGQEVGNLDWFGAYSKEEKKRLTNMAEFKPNGFLPLPMWHGQRLLHTGRNFKLPFDVCSPLPPGQPKPDEWRKVPKNRFVGNAAAAWKKSTVFDDFSSRCVCSRQGGCDESCQNRIMLYECDDGNCSTGRDRCTNRAFANLKERRSKGGKYRIGVEVIKTADRGYGVRSNRCFDAHQIIVEYTGEIITEDECDRRMNEVYKDNECYYLMLFDQNMIIDATRGSIARFVNHSCEPNCRMVKWIVAGKPRMALFAGDRPIMTGEELTYDYNFDPFSAKNVQECRCGADSCRGVLGPRPKDKPKISVTFGETLKQVVGVGKRKLAELLTGDKDAEKTPKKKRRIAVPARTSASAHSSGAVKGMKRGLSKANTSTKNGRVSAIVQRRSTKSAFAKTYSSKPGAKRQTFIASPRNSSLALVTDPPGDGKGKGKGKKGEKKTAKRVKKDLVGTKLSTENTRSVRKRSLSPKGKEFYKSKAKTTLKSKKKL